MVFGAILAGGVGSRMHMADMPKQFLPLGDKPIIVHTLEKFLTSSELDAVYIGVHADWVNYMNDLIEKYIPENGRVILAGNHTNYFDCILVGCATDRCVHYLAKDELMKGPLKIIFKNFRF